MAIKEDITERKLIEAKLQKIAWKQSHEIRGPLATLMGIVTVMNYDITLDETLTIHFIFTNKMALRLTK